LKFGRKHLWKVLYKVSSKHNSAHEASSFFFIISVPGKASAIWYLQDESNSQRESSKKEPSFEIVVPDDIMNLERSGSCGSKKKIKPVGSFEYIVSFI
jgi:hypothetical protein